MPEIITMATYNIRHGKGNDSKLSLIRVAETLKKINADIVALQEVDKFAPRSWFQNQAKILARHTMMQYAFAPNIGFSFPSYGNAVLSKYSILEHGNLFLPGQERRGLQYCTLELVSSSKKITVFNTHLGLSQEERKLQIAAIVKELPKAAPFVLLAGDFNCPPTAEELEPLSSHLRYAFSKPVNTFPSLVPLYPVDHIYTSIQWKVSSMSVYSSDASDHLPLVCELVLNV